MAKMSRDKGKRGELEVAALLQKYGFEARRGQQFAGGGDSPDVIHKLPWPFHIEVKYVERFSLYAALEQANADRKAGSVPIVFHRRKRQPWVTVVEAGIFLKMMDYVRRLEQKIQEVENGQT